MKFRPAGPGAVGPCAPRGAGREGGSGRRKQSLTLTGDFNLTFNSFHLPAAWGSSASMKARIRGPAEDPRAPRERILKVCLRNT